MSRVFRHLQMLTLRISEQLWISWISAVQNTLSDSYLSCHFWLLWQLWWVCRCFVINTWLTVRPTLLTVVSTNGKRMQMEVWNPLIQTRHLGILMLRVWALCMYSLLSRHLPTEFTPKMADLKWWSQCSVMELNYTNILAGHAGGFAFRLYRLVSSPNFLSAVTVESMYSQHHCITFYLRSAICIF